MLAFRPYAFFAISILAFAQPIVADHTVSAVTPASGPTTGRTVVTISGSGFSHCTICTPPAPNAVTFGTIAAREVRLINSNTLEAVTPAHVPGMVDVVVYGWENDGAVVLRNAFTFIGQMPEEMERLLIPVLTPPVRGAFGSEFHTELRARSKRSSGVRLFGLTPPRPSTSPDPCMNVPVTIADRDALDPIDLNGQPGRFVFVAKSEIDSLAANLRVRDVTRAALNLGTEVPIVREREFMTGFDSRLMLLNVPTDPRFRNTLRIYSTAQQVVEVLIEGPSTRQYQAVTLRPGRDIFDPAYGEFSDFPIVDGPLRLTLSVSVPPVTTPLPPSPVWAFISVTNNETQMITTITPQP